MEVFRFDWGQFGIDLLKLGIAFLLTLPIAWEREQSTRIMGLRTFPLVAVASCGYVLIALAVIGASEDGQARIIQGLMSGIGFIGGGAILKEGVNVRGTATAASVWTTGAIGSAIAYSRYEIAILLSLVNYLTLRILTPIERQTGKADQRDED
ncbi:MgtC/SapB family protein [Nostoc sp. FACHB-892]|uniref:MgtC/SapB family protein n=1 Tax=Nostoc sp. FACHB-892 TaxID=2692843 RepID=UPI0016892ED7|nr:MgtC/SapB family protein [Nostoc sp. FACHB-892]MBD2725525.1 MgtC/SapB family protein [Nostoc sp. FACHB-892]